MSEIVIREARPEDYDKLLRLIRQILTESGAQKASYFDAETWRWQCLTPGFETLIVIAEDDKVLAGCFHLVSKPMNVFGQSGRVALLQELAVAPEYRRKGIFTRMSRFASDQMSIRGWDVTYSMPNLRSYPGFIKNQGYQHLAWVPIRVRPLDTGQLLADRFPPAKLWQLAGDVIGSLFDTLFPLAGPKEDYTIESINQFDSEVDALSRDFLDHTGIGLQRNARFLNWRFLGKPTGDFTAWGLRRDGQLRAYLVTCRAQLFGYDTLLLMDFGCLAGDGYLLRALVAERMVAEREDNAALAVTAGTHPFFHKLARLGFVRVPERLNSNPLPLIAQYHSDRFSDEIYDVRNWFISLADWDVL